MRLSQLAYTRLRMATVRFLLDATGSGMCVGHRPSCGLAMQVSRGENYLRSSRPRAGRAVFKAATRVATLCVGARPRCGPAAALMFIHDADGLHERIADRRTHEIEALFLQVLAHGVAVRRRWLDVAEVEGATAQHT